VNRSLGSRYVLHDVLGRGAMGEVFRGSVRESGAPVAVKVLKAELVADTEVVSRFVQERSILTSIDHPNVVRVIDLVVEGETLGIVMELARGQDLRRTLAEERTHPPVAAARLFRQVLAGLTAVHDAGVLHRDVKPENILLDFYGDRVRVKLTDFGVARLTYGTSLTRTTGLIGTPDYMAPETALAGTATSASDLYSAGIVLYEMLAGRTPFGAGPPLGVLLRQAEEPPPPIPGLPLSLWAYLESLLAKDPDARPRSAAQASDTLRALEPQLAGLPALPPMTAVPAPGSSVRLSPGLGPDRNGSLAASLAGSSGRGTVLRHRDRGGPPGEIAGPEPDRSRSHRSGSAALNGHRPVRSRLRSWPVVLGLAAAVAVAAVVIGLLHARSPSRPPAASHQPPTVSYTFPSQRYRTGLVATRRWTLSGQDGTVLTETITLRSATGKALTTWFKDNVPAAIANTMQALRFSIAPAKIVNSDPVVEWYVRLPAHGSLTIGYVAAVPPQGATTARLESWAKGLDTVEGRLNTPTPTSMPSVPAPTPTPSAPQPVIPFPTYSSPLPSPSPDQEPFGGGF
jgi:serine/threonine protein kinase, bacterial